MCRQCTRPIDWDASAHPDAVYQARRLVWALSAWNEHNLEYC